MTSFSTNTGDEIEKFSQPKNPIYRVEYVQTNADGFEGGNDYYLEVEHYSVVGELLPLNSKDKKMISEFDEYKKKNPDEVKGDWLDKLQHSNFDTLKLNDYLNKMRFEGNIHLKLFKHLQRTVEGSKKDRRCWLGDSFDSKSLEHVVIIKIERIA